MVKIDINCDMGEGMNNDALIMPYISSANIACGKHAGNRETMRETLLLAKKHGVKVGAHPSFDDKENFGRTEMKISFADLYELVLQQVEELDLMCSFLGLKMHHVKPHGALYNMAAKNKRMATVIAMVVKTVRPDLILYGLSGSYIISEAQALGLKTASEVFADRTYQDDGSLTPRTESNALIESEEQSIQQVLKMVEHGTVTSVSGKEIKLHADTICIHGDGEHAVAFAKNIYETLKMNTD